MRLLGFSSPLSYTAPSPLLNTIITTIINKYFSVAVFSETYALLSCKMTTTTLFNGPFPGLPGWIWILLKQETVSGRGISWAICKSAPCSRQITVPAPHNSVFYRPDALPADHQKRQSTEGNVSCQMSRLITDPVSAYCISDISEKWFELQTCTPAWRPAAVPNWIYNYIKLSCCRETVCRFKVLSSWAYCGEIRVTIRSCDG